MISTKSVELHFIDGPLQGTRKMELEDVIHRNRTYRYLAPTSIHAEQLIPNNTAQVWTKVTCIEYHYLPFRLPPAYGQERFAMCLDQGLN
jgi:hypothetical protein